MGKNVLLIAILAVVAACGLAAAPAGAATIGRAEPSVTTLGTRCTTVRSALHQRVGVICVSVINRGAAPGRQLAEVTFRASSGTLREVSAGNLVYVVNGQVVVRTGPIHRFVRGAIGVLFSGSWCCGRPHMHYLAQSAAFNACMNWRGGGTACTGRRWFRSLVVRF